MGMFDWIRCELALPDGKDAEFQTKDAQEICEMKEFLITGSGRLIKHEYDSEVTPEDELPHKDAPDGSWLRMCGCIRKIAGSDRDVDMNFDGDLHFYANLLKYRATFRLGQCVEICRFVNDGWERISLFFRRQEAQDGRSGGGE